LCLLSLGLERASGLLLGLTSVGLASRLLLAQPSGLLSLSLLGGSLGFLLLQLLLGRLRFRAQLLGPRELFLSQSLGLFAALTSRLCHLKMLLSLGLQLLLSARVLTLHGGALLRLVVRDGILRRQPHGLRAVTRFLRLALRFLSAARGLLSLRVDGAALVLSSERAGLAVPCSLSLHLRALLGFVLVNGTGGFLLAGLGVQLRLLRAALGSLARLARIFYVRRRGERHVACGRGGRCGARDRFA
jgi:hypothetical protein